MATEPISTTTPPTALTRDPAASGPAVPAPACPPAGPAAATVRRAGVGLCAGAVAFAAGLAASTAVQDPASLWSHVGGLLFQGGLWGLLVVLHRTRATGDGRFGRGLLWTVAALLVPATVSSAVSLVAPPSATGATWYLLLDVCWPLSMLGMAVIGVTVAVVGRYRGALRWWPMVAESWALVTVPTVALAGPVAGGVVGTVHALLGYGVLGLLLARRPELTGRS
ncbi:hypothetical protein [Pseudonocardia sp. ICBG1034]|uniref:hypothetical protein n=1 Tax=Pseudonocardia sp. ICBG1034 TaxID=2844381 RepID=UPI001CCF3A0B|nr:hypothetical protein [Pseudonocardia sp. ICBG1034]